MLYILNFMARFESVKKDESYQVRITQAIHTKLF